MNEDNRLDNRHAVVAEILRSFSIAPYSIDLASRQIIEALDQRALATKWEGRRYKILLEACECWIPRSDLLEYLNTLPGAPLTMAEMVAKMREMLNRIGDVGPYDKDPAVQADCLRVYNRERAAGTEFSVIIQTIHHEVLGPALRKRIEEAAQRARELNLKRARSGKDFGFIPSMKLFAPGSDNEDNHYLRHAGQLYRLQRTTSFDVNSGRPAAAWARGPPALADEVIE